jgi:hypothetical protein
VVGTYYAQLLLVGPRFIDVLVAHALTGWKATPVVAPQLRVELFLLSGTGTCGPILRASAGKPVGGFSFGRFIDGTLWDGSDLFVPDNEDVLLVGPAAQRILQAARLTNLDLPGAGLEPMPARLGHG